MSDLLRDFLGTGLQNGLAPVQRTNNPTIKLGKVISVHPEDGSIDVMMLDATASVTVPMLSHYMGSNFGVSCLTGPSYDPLQPAKKTYPQSGEDTQHSPTISSKVGRDTYAVVLQLEGSFLGTADACVIGFLPAQVSEMLFARHEMNDDGTPTGEEGEFDDMLLVRHPSDVQMTLDKNSKLSVQLPNGTRLTMGEDISAVNLIKKDYDQRYELRENTGKSADAYVAAVDADGHKRADLLVSASGTIDGIVYDAEDKKRAEVILLSTGRLIVRVYSPDDNTPTAFIDLKSIGEIEGYAVQEVRFSNQAGSLMRLSGGNAYFTAPINVRIEAGANVEIIAGAEISLTAGAHIVGQAARIDWN